jgi:hypothetical protein
MTIPTIRPSFFLQTTSVHFVLIKNKVTKPFCLNKLDFYFIFFLLMIGFFHIYVDLVIIKMKKPWKKKTLTSSWEGPYQSIGHADGNGNFDFEESSKICITKNVDGH